MWSVDRPYVDGLVDGLDYPDRLELNRPVDRPTFFSGLADRSTVTTQKKKGGGGAAWVTTAARNLEIHVILTSLQLFYLFVIYMSNYKIRKSCLLATKSRVPRMLRRTPLYMKIQQSQPKKNHLKDYQIRTGSTNQ